MKNIRRVLLKLVVLFSLFLNSYVYAGIPTTDYANLAQEMYANITSMFNHEELLAYFQQKVEHLANVTGLTIDSENNAKANAISRINAAAQDIYNLEVARGDMPSSEACKDFSFSIQLDDVIDDLWCDMVMSSNESEEVATNSIPFSGEDINDVSSYNTEEEYRDGYLAPEVKKSFRHKRNKQIVDRIKDNLPVQNDSGRGIDDENWHNSSLSAKNIMGGEVYSLNQEQYLSAVDFVYLVAPPYESKRAQKAFSPVLSTLQLSDAAKQNLANLILKGILSERYKENSRSKLELLMSYGDEKYSPYEDQDDTYLEVMATSDLFSPHALLRDMAIVHIFQNRMAIEKYERSLKRELAKATLLSQKLSYNYK